MKTEFACVTIVAEALDRVSARTGCTVVGVNCAYTSQLDSRFGTLTGERKGDKFTGHDGVVMHGDTNAADNVLIRMEDSEIPRYMKYSVAHVILLERTRKFREMLTPTWAEVFEAITEKDDSQSLEPRQRKARRVNQAVNKSKQLTLFGFG